MALRNFSIIYIWMNLDMNLAQGQHGQSDTSKSKELSWFNVLTKQTGSFRLTHCCVYKIHAAPIWPSIGSRGFFNLEVLSVVCVGRSWRSGVTSAVTAGLEPVLRPLLWRTQVNRLCAPLYSWLALVFSVSWECPSCSWPLFSTIYTYISKTWKDTEWACGSCDGDEVIKYWPCHWN